MSCTSDCLREPKNLGIALGLFHFLLIFLWYTEMPFISACSIGLGGGLLISGALNKMNDKEKDACSKECPLETQVLPAILGNLHCALNKAANFIGNAIEMKQKRRTLTVLGTLIVAKSLTSIVCDCLLIYSGVVALIAFPLVSEKFGTQISQVKGKATSTINEKINAVEKMIPKYERKGN